MTTAPGGVQLLSHFPLKWNNQLKQIGGNIDNERSSALHAKTNGWRGHLHMAYFRQTMFDLWRSWVVSMSQERTLPFCHGSAPTSDFHVHRTDGEDRNVLDRANVQLNLFSKSWSDFSCLSLPTVLKDQQWSQLAMEQPLHFPGKSTVPLWEYHKNIAGFATFSVNSRESTHIYWLEFGEQPQSSMWVMWI